MTAFPLAPELEARVHRVTFDTHADSAMVTAVNRLIAAAPGIWIYYCYNAEYLFYPFCETRTIREMLTFQAEERRDAVLSYVIDLYAGDLDRFPNAVSLEGAQLDRSGYYALGRPDVANHNHPKERQLDFFGGLRWRFEEHIPLARRKIDRIALFRAKPDLELRPDFTFSDEEYNTYSCPWHHNITTAIASFRTAKALRSNAGLRVRHPLVPLAQLDPVPVAQPAVDGPWPDGAGAVVLSGGASLSSRPTLARCWIVLFRCPEPHKVGYLIVQTAAGYCRRTDPPATRTSVSEIGSIKG